MQSQTILKKEPRIKTFVDSKGDTLIQMRLSDAKLILNDVLEKQVLDSIIAVHDKMDSINSVTIILQLSKIKLLQDKNSNQTIQIKNLEQILANKDKEVAILTEIQHKQKKEIRKQKILKIIGFSAAVVLPITVAIISGR